VDKRSVKRALSLTLIATLFICVAGTSSLVGCRGAKGDVPDDAADTSTVSGKAALEASESQPAATSPASEDAPEETTPVKAEVEEPEPPAFDHAPFDALLAAHVDQDAGRVDYDGFKADEAKLDAYLATIAAAELDQLDERETYALLINAYNAYTIKLILERYPKIKSIRDYKEPWKQVRWEVGGETVSLDAIEHERLRPVYKDPRIHFAVNCASIGCPPLRSEAYTSERLDEQLDAATRATLSNSRYVTVKKGTLYVTRLMEWYGGDFVNPEWEGAGENIAAFVKPYASEEVAALIEEKGGEPRVKFLEYDWNLNKK